MFRLLAAIIALCAVAWAAPGSPEQSTCTFTDGGSLRVEYTPEPSPMKNGEVWTPGNQPVVMFLDTPVKVENVSLPIGAYGLYILPEKGRWKLIVNRYFKPGSEYDAKGDIVRAAMASSALSRPVDRPQLSLVHPAPSQCELQVSAGSVIAWKEIAEDKPQK